jgi:hypothetical protein
MTRRKFKCVPSNITALMKMAMRAVTQEHADEIFAALIEESMASGVDRESAEDIQRSNLGYTAGYYDAETRERVERLFNCVHPIFGPIAEKGQPTSDQAFRLGQQMAATRGPFSPLFSQPKSRREEKAIRKIEI